MPDQPATYSDPSGAMLTLDSARGWGKPEHVVDRHEEKR